MGGFADGNDRQFVLVTALFASNGLIRLQIKSGFFQRISLDFCRSQSQRREAHPEHMVCNSELNYPARRMDGRAPSVCGGPWAGAGRAPMGGTAGVAAAGSGRPLCPCYL